MERIDVRYGDCREVIKRLADNSIDSVVTDPPYALVSIVKRFGKPGSAPARGDVYARASAGFMGKSWDTGEVAFAPEFWAEVLRVLKPGGHVLVFGGTRSYHRLVCAIEDAGFEIRDQIGWLYGQGFPKSHNVAKGIDRVLGAEPTVVKTVKRRDIRNNAAKLGRVRGSGVHQAERDGAEYIDHAVTKPTTPEAAAWEGWGTALKPAWEPICLARKPLSEKNVAENVLKWRTGAVNVDGCRVEQHELGRWPANVLHDGSDEVIAAFPDAPGQFADISTDAPSPKTSNVYGRMNREGEASAHSLSGGDVGCKMRPGQRRLDSGSAARFFYCAKATAEDRMGSKHPTVKPINLIAYLVRLVTPKGGVVLDPFAGSGTLAIAALREGVRAVLIEREDEYAADIRARLEMFDPTGRPVAQLRARKKKGSTDEGPIKVNG